MARFLLLSSPPDRTPHSEAISPRVLAAVGDGLATLGHAVARRHYRPGLMSEIARDPGVEIIFNLVYGYSDGRGRTRESQPEAAARIAALPQPLVGSEPRAQALAQDKLRCGRFLSAHGIAVPAEEGGAGRDRPPFVVLKPRYGACHRDVRVVPSARVDADRLGADTLVQEYVAGPEYTVGVVEGAAGPQALPPLEIVFPRPERPHVLGSRGQEPVYALDDRDRHDLRSLSERIFMLLGLRDYARLDFRICDRRGPVLLDANALPNLDPERSFLPMAARMAGMSFAALLGAVVEGAIGRLARRSEVVAARGPQ
jgi:D-alanine-D-alanine ligase